ncbi:MAG: EAL domain-containing protein, partial [Desulfuromonadaceae bacterium]
GNREATAALEDTLVAEMSLNEVERSLRLAYGLFFHDLSEDYSPSSNVTQVVDELRALLDRLATTEHAELQQQLLPLQQRCALIAAGLGYYDAAERRFASDRQLFASRLHFELTELVRQAGALKYLAGLRSSEQNTVAALYELALAAQELFRQVLESPVHQPEMIIRLLERVSDRLETSMRTEHPEHVATIKSLLGHLTAIRLNLPGVYRRSWDSNLFYLGDEIRKISTLWDRAQLDLDLLLQSEKKLFANKRREIIQVVNVGRFHFTLLLVVGSLSALLLAVILSRTLSARMRPLVAGIRSCSRGERMPRLAVNGTDDLAMLAQAFNEMGDRLQVKDEELQQTFNHLLSSQASLQEAHSLLEVRVTERTRELQSANDKLLLMGKVFDHAGEGILVMDYHGRIIMANPRILQITGFSAAEFSGRKPVVFNLSERGTFLSKIRDSVRRGGEWLGELPLTDRSGAVIPTDVSVSAYHHADGALAGMIAIFHDLRKIREQEETIRFQAFHDALTGLPNRLLLVDHLGYAMKRAKRRGHKTGIFFFDLDNFKKINDTQGHAFGDALLLTVAERLRQHFRAEDMVCRIGGDEFVAVLEDSPDIRCIVRKAQELIQVMSGYIEVQGKKIHISSSIGIAVYPDHGGTVDELMKNADLAMYAAKGQGKNTYYLFTRVLDEKSREDLALEEALRKSLQDGDFEVYFQPQVNIKDMQLVGAEALVRWVDKSGAIVSPARFIPLCEETGLIFPLGQFVLRTTCHYAAAMCRRRGFEHLRFSVNVSPKQFSDPHFLDSIVDALAESGMDPTNLEIEITESSMLVNVEHTRNLLSYLGALGVSIAIDDFGTGYSSLLQLKKFPIHTLKIDSSFVRDVPGDVSDEKIVETIITMARNLGIAVIAEGVENEAQRDYLQRHGCQTMQGYFISPPVRGEEFFSCAERLSA